MLYNFKIIVNWIFSFKKAFLISRWLRSWRENHLRIFPWVQNCKYLKTVYTIKVFSFVVRVFSTLSVLRVIYRLCKSHMWWCLDPCFNFDHCSKIKIKNPLRISYRIWNEFIGMLIKQRMFKTCVMKIV